MKTFNLYLSHRLILFFSIVLLFCSCDKNNDLSKNVDLESNDEVTAIMEFLCNEVHSCDDIEVQGDAIIFDGDVALDKSSLLQFMSQANQLEPEKITITLPHPINKDEKITTTLDDVQYYDKEGHLILEDRQKLTDYWRFARNSDVGYIKYFIRDSALDSGCNGGYESAITAAITHLNSIIGTKIYFSRSYAQSQSDIIIGCDTDLYFRQFSQHHYNIPNSIRARATLVEPGSRTIGKHISINDNFSGSENDKKGLLIHEILHCIGLAHTNGSSGFHLYDSPLVDDHSIMNTPGTPWLSNNEDQKVLRRVWPTYLYQPTNFSIPVAGSSYMRLNFTNAYSNNPYNNVYVAHWYNGSFQPFGYWGHQPAPGGNYDIWWLKNYPPGDHYFCVIGGSHGGEVFSSWTGWHLVSL